MYPQSTPSPVNFCDDEMSYRSVEQRISEIGNPSVRTRAQNAAYLLGASQTIPAPTQEEVNQLRAVQLCYDAMSGSNTGEDNRDGLSAGLPENGTFPFSIPINTTKPDTVTTCIEVTFAVDDSREDIFSRICAYMGVPRAYEKLGWRLNSSRRSDPPHRLLTFQDVDAAFKEAQGARGTGKRKKRVVIEIVNTQPSISKNESDHIREQAPSMTPYIRKLELVKEVARCNEHQGNDTWCWVDQNNHNHIPLCLNDLQIWAKFLHEECIDTTCISPPKRLITELTTTRMPRGSSSLARTLTELIPVIHNHVHIPSSNGSTTPFESRDNTLPSSGAVDLKRQHTKYLESDDELDEGEDQFTVKKILDQLHAKYPAMDFPLYEESLRTLGICYLVSADMFDGEFYVREAKMGHGAAYLFKEYVSKELRKAVRARERRKAKGKKKARFDDEDVENIAAASTFIA